MTTLIPRFSLKQRWMPQLPLLDLARRPAVFIAGSGRSGTTWLQEVINHRRDHRIIFEPFLATVTPFCHAFLRKQYIRDKAPAPEFLDPAHRILSGKFRHEWADKYNHRWLYRKRLVKDIRANLFLYWLHLHVPEMPIIYILRHPCAVVASQLQMGWHFNASELFLTQPNLVSDYLEPFIDVIRGAQDQFDHMMIIWCIENFIPLQKFGPGDFLFVFYEELLAYPERELERLFSFLGRPLEASAFEQMKHPSDEARHWSAIHTGADLLNAWRAYLSPDQVRRARRYLRLFGFDSIYSEDTMPQAPLALSRPQIKRDREG